MAHLATEIGISEASPRPFQCQWVQSWRHLLFAHWPAPIRSVQRLLPSGLDPDCFDGQAWVSAVAFHLTTRPTGLPSVPLCSDLWELNLRTYVRCANVAAVTFLSMHGSRRSAVWLGRRLTPLPYAFARISAGNSGVRRHFRCSDRSGPPLFEAAYEIDGAEFAPEAQSLDAWLLERYVAIVPDRRGRLKSMRVRHPPWRVLPVRAQVSAVGLGRPFGLELDDAPVPVHSAAGLRAEVGPFELVAAET